MRFGEIELQHLGFIHHLAISQRRLRSFLSNFTMADVEVVDPKKCLEESCKPKCVKPLLEYQACVKRVQGDESGHKHCTGQYFDYWQCVDKCVGPKLFAELK
ncbi:cytochrome b-c1 complex subunit 6-1, mitochondrial isoform X1 [Brassica napus]|uniref:cytochrome b-c1 complex subunit 6-1, mitochondrial isoform X1 n=2 Tax=Brassica napus TaxID=3708 RepID=UPI002078552F|nr:cytochrome b-c1 complex subunit 6-1, mitochondrial isoform X1 [Brassica napus]